MIEQLIELRRSRKTYRQIAQMLGLAVSTVARHLKQAGFHRLAELEPAPVVVRYEYANSFLYLNSKREIERALAELDKAAAQKPRFAMEALDAMYAAKRRREIRALAEWKGTFRSFERKRLAWQKRNNNNLYCVLPKDCPAFIIQ